MKIKVTQRHINEGLALRCYECPVVLAIRDASDTEAMAGLTTLYTLEKFTGRILTMCPTPDEVKNFMRSFDGRKPVQPFQFEVPL